MLRHRLGHEDRLDHRDHKTPEIHSKPNRDHGSILTAIQTSSHFSDELILRSRRLGHPLCVGLDPHLDRIPQLFRQGSMKPGDPRTADAVDSFLRAILEQVAPRVAIVKPQIAFFEQLGWRGLQILEGIVARAQELGLLVLTDAKRGDIGSTAAAYARTFLAADAPCPSDALTINPYLGLDSLQPFLDAADANGRGLFVLLKTSNPGAAEFQDVRVQESDSSDEATGTLFERIARTLEPLAESRRGPVTGWSSLGCVVGATFPEDAEKARNTMPHTLFLVPGYGAQGGSAKAAVHGFVRGPAGLEGGLVNSSRGILFPVAGDHADAKTWTLAIDQALDRAIDELGEAVTT